MTEVVLCYHAVSDGWEHALSVRPHDFERQIRSFLRRGLRLHVTFDDAFRNVVDVLPFLRRLEVRTTIFVCSDHADDGAPLTVRELAAEPLDELATLTWDELRGLHDVAIGSHTRSHPHLRSLAHDELVDELRTSRARIEAELGRACSAFAYPYGEQDARVRDTVRAAGYTEAYGLPGRPGDPFLRPRAGIFRRDGLLRVNLKCTRAAAALAARREQA
ncbi:MAG: polysaccharide deacetylase family protein [Actinobacteria bacterium]|nr:polysaccharide deacetylase family protein [Actinomycetota bacterium]